MSNWDYFTLLIWDMILTPFITGFWAHFVGGKVFSQYIFSQRRRNSCETPNSWCGRRRQKGWDPAWMSRWKWTDQWLGSVDYNPKEYSIYKKVKAHLLTIDPNFLGHPSGRGPWCYSVGFSGSPQKHGLGSLGTPFGPNPILSNKKHDLGAGVAVNFAL